jgi:sulfur carrier protein
LASLCCCVFPFIAETLAMELTINNERREFTDGLTLAALVEHLGMKADRVAVELNLEIVARASWQSTQLKNGDKLEIVHFVGGGSGSMKLTRLPSISVKPGYPPRRD